jgi:pyruvate oxidase
LFPVEVRNADIYVGLAAEPDHEPTITDVMATTLVNWGLQSVFGMVGHSNLGLADALRRQEQAGGEWPVWETSLHNPNFASYAKLCGDFGIRVKTADELRAAIQQGLDYEGPAIVEVVSDVELI